MWFTPSPAVIDIMKEIHEIVHRTGLSENEREVLVRYHWFLMERRHGGTIMQIGSPNGEKINRPDSLNGTRSWFTPTPREISAIEQIETVFLDDNLTQNARESLIKEWWQKLEQAHQGKVLYLISPEDAVIERPWD